MELAGDVPGRRRAAASPSSGVWTTLKKAAADSNIKAIVLEPEGLAGGWGKLEEIRADLERFRKSGKPVYAYLRTPGGPRILPGHARPTASISGPRTSSCSRAARRTDVLQEDAGQDRRDVRGGARRQVQRFGDMFTRTDMSPETREVITSMVDGLYGNLVARIAAGRKKTRR